MLRHTIFTNSGRLIHQEDAEPLRNATPVAGTRPSEPREPFETAVFETNGHRASQTPASVFAPLGALMSPFGRTNRSDPAIPLATLPPLDIATTPPAYLCSVRNPGVLLRDPVLLANGDTVDRSELEEGEVHGDNEVLRIAMKNRQTMLDAAANGAPINDKWRTDVQGHVQLEPFELPVQVLSKVTETAPDTHSHARIPTGNLLQETYVHEASDLQTWVGRHGTSLFSAFPLKEPLIVAPNFAVQALCAEGEVSPESRAELTQAAQAIVMPQPERREQSPLYRVVRTPLTAMQMHNLRLKLLVAGGITTCVLGAGGTLLGGAMSQGSFAGEIGGAVIGSTAGLTLAGYKWRRTMANPPTNPVTIEVINAGRNAADNAGAGVAPQQDV